MLTQVHIFPWSRDRCNHSGGFLIEAKIHLKDQRVVDLEEHAFVRCNTSSKCEHIGTVFTNWLMVQLCFIEKLKLIKIE